MLRCSKLLAYRSMTTIAAPALLHLAMEPFRGAVAQIVGGLSAGRLASRVPQGHGQPVIVIPGLGTDELSTRTLRRFLRLAGYRTYDWGLGFNVGPRGGIETWLDRLQGRLCDVAQKNGQQPVHLVGWSLGGIYARELAKRCPDQVRQVVTLGTPLSGDPDATHGKLLFRLLAGEAADADAGLLSRIRVAPPVPCHSLYSKLDGVVGWEASKLDDDKQTAVEVCGVSHLGLVSDPRSLETLANVLAGVRPIGSEVRTC